MAGIWIDGECPECGLATKVRPDGSYVRPHAWANGCTYIGVSPQPEGVPATMGSHEEPTP